AVELHVGMGYARLAREEYLWARRAFEAALALDPDQEDALAGWGEVLLKFGDRAGALACFDRILALGLRDDQELMLQIGRALFRLERTAPEDHFDGLGIWRLIELKKSVYRLCDHDPELVPWHRRLDELARAEPEDLLFAEIAALGPAGRVRDPRQLEMFGTLL